MKKVLLITLIVISIPSIAQKVELSDNQLNISILPLGLSYERKIDDNKSLTLGGGIGGFSVGSGEFSVYPALYGGFRNYYERKRIKKDNLRNNSGNYFGLFTSNHFKAIGSDRNRTSPRSTVGLVWGMQRNYASGIHLGFSVGPGLIGGKNIKTRATIVGQFEFGFRLFAK